MRNTDWGGKPPSNPQEARDRLLEAAFSCVEKYGLAKTNIKRVAEEVGVTRQTVYRYFSSSEELVAAVSFSVGGGLLSRMQKQIEKLAGFEDRVIESVLFLAKSIPGDAFLSQYFSVDEQYRHNIEQVFSKTPLEFSYQAVRSMYCTSAVSKPEEKWLKGVAEHALRMVLVLIIAPSENTRSSRAMRAYLNNWLRPALVRPANLND